MKSKKSNILDIVDIEKKFSAAKRLAEHMGIVDGWAVLKANEIVLDSTGIDCLNVFEMPKRVHETLTERDDRIVKTFLITCCEHVDGSDATFEMIYNSFKEYCIKMSRQYIHRKVFIKALSSYYNVNNLEKIDGISLKEDTMSDQDAT